LRQIKVRLRLPVQTDEGRPVMRAMLLDAPGRPLRAVELPMPVPGPGQVLVRV